MAIAVQAWAEQYKKVTKKTGIAIVGGGTRRGIAGLINGTADIANASRAISNKETRFAEEKGKHPVEHVVGYDAIAIYLHKNNPLTKISYDQLAEIYGKTGTADKWSDLGVNVPGCKDQEIIRVSRQNNSGTYAYLKDKVLKGKRGYRLGSRDMQSSKDVVALVENTPCAVGYSSQAYITPNIKVLCLAKEKGQACVNPSVQAAIDGSYPLARPLFMYTDGEPEGEIKAYIDWVLSDAGQCILRERGYAPVRPIDCDR